MINEYRAKVQAMIAKRDAMEAAGQLVGKEALVAKSKLDTAKCLEIADGIKTSSAWMQRLQDGPMTVDQLVARIFAGQLTIDNSKVATHL